MPQDINALSRLTAVIRWDEFYMAPSATTINENGKHWQSRCFSRELFSREKVGFPRDALRSQVIDMLEAQEIKENSGAPLVAHGCEDSISQLPLSGAATF
jgi:hypothetical protein